MAGRSCPPLCSGFVSLSDSLFFDLGVCPRYVPDTLSERTRGEHRMHPQTKIRFDAIERAQKLLEAAPEPRLEEVSKSHAARILIPQIRDAQSKGYSLRAIASLLADSGIPVSASLLKTLLSQERSRTVSKTNPRVEPTIRRRSAPHEARSRPRPEPSSNPARAGVTASTRRGPAPESDRQEDSLDPRSPPAPAVASTPSPPPSPPHRRSSFVPRPDTEDI